MVKITKDDIGRKIRVTDDAYAFPYYLVGRVGTLAGLSDDSDGFAVVRVSFDDDDSWFTRPDSIEFVDECLLKAEVMGYDEESTDSFYEVKIGDTTLRVPNDSVVSISGESQDLEEPQKNEEKRKVRVFDDGEDNVDGYLNFDEDLKDFFISSSIELEGFKIKFTKAEIVEANKLPQFKYVDLVQAWEDGE